MNKSEFIHALAEKTGSKIVEAEKNFEAVLETITEALKAGDDIKLVGFGNFSVVKKEARKGRNPKSGKEINIPATKALKFKPGKELKDAVNK